MAKLPAHIVVADRIPAGGKSYRIEADEAERRALAEQLGISEVMALSAELHLRPLAGQSYGVKGVLTARVAQTDVVTLEPVEQSLDEVIDLTLVPAEDDGDGEGVSHAPGGEDTPERDTYANGRIDLDAIVREHLALGLDPYPRAPGVEFSGHIEDDSAPDSSPFAALAPLKEKPD